MNGMFRTVCMLAIGCAAWGSAGCAGKSIQSGGSTSSQSPAPKETVLSESDLPDRERVNSGIVMAEANPIDTKRQMQEMRAEQTATTAAGLRDVFFGYDSWTIDDAGRQALTRDADWLRTHPAIHVKVEGHCDERGSSTYNFVLAEKRAKSVRNYLLGLGVPRDRVVVVSYGKERPFCKDRSESCYQQNRRGHLVVKP